jgi:hypothetical protein
VRKLNFIQEDCRQEFNSMHWKFTWNKTINRIYRKDRKGKEMGQITKKDS